MCCRTNSTTSATSKELISHQLFLEFEWIFMPKESILNSRVTEAGSLMEVFLRGWKDENTVHIQRCQEREKHILAPQFDVWESSRTPDGGAEARITDSLTYAICHGNMLQHQLDITKSLYSLYKAQHKIFSTFFSTSAHGWIKKSRAATYYIQTNSLCY